MAEDSVKVAPDVYKVVLENDRVRVLESTMSPGQATEMHSHPAMVVVALDPGRYRLTSPGAEPMELDFPVDVPMYMEPTEHATENTGDNAGRVLMVELKG